MQYRPREIELIDKEMGGDEIETPAGYVWDIFMEERGPMTADDVISAFKAVHENTTRKGEILLKEAIKRLTEAGFLHEVGDKFYPIANKV